MSIASVKAAVTPLLTAAVIGLTVKDRNQLDTLTPPIALMPLVLLRDRPHTSQPLAIGAEARDWWLDCMLWNTYQVNQDQADFDSMRETIEKTLRTHTLLGGSADDATYNTKLYVSGRSIESHDYPAMFAASGRTYRHCLISSLIREAVFFTAAV